MLSVSGDDPHSVFSCYMYRIKCIPFCSFSGFHFPFITPWQLETTSFNCTMSFVINLNSTRFTDILFALLSIYIYFSTDVYPPNWFFTMTINDPLAIPIFMKSNWIKDAAALGLFIDVRQLFLSNRRRAHVFRFVNLCELENEMSTEKVHPFQNLISILSMNAHKFERFLASKGSRWSLKSSSSCRLLWAFGTRFSKSGYTLWCPATYILLLWSFLFFLSSLSRYLYFWEIHLFRPWREWKIIQCFHDWKCRLSAILSMFLKYSTQLQ